MVEPIVTDFQIRQELLEPETMKPKFNRPVTFSILSFLIIVMVAQFGFAQDWRVNQPRVQPVPQYIPRYPLDAGNQPSGQKTPANIRSQITKPNSVAKPSSVKSKQPAPKKPATKKPATQKPTKKPAKKPTTKKPTTSKKSSSKKKPAKKDAKKKKDKIDPHYGVDYSVYRDKNMYPIDPRKPCNQCVRPQAQSCNGCGGKLFGNHGRPYMEHEPGGCTCQKKKPGKHPSFSIHWPRPFSAKLDERHPERAAARYSPCQPKRIVDVFDHLSTLKLSHYKRSDNGHSGIGSDSYGCLGETNQPSRVAGVGYRFPSQPIERGFDSIGTGYEYGMRIQH